MADVNYHRLRDEFHKHDNYDVMFRSTLDDVAGKVDFSQVKSCIAFGTSSGEHEIEFARRLLPNLRSFTAVEPDPVAVKTLRASFQEGQLPGVETSVVETTIEGWSGVDSHVDAVLLFNVLAHVHSADRKALFQKLTTHLNSGGIAVVIGNVTSLPSGHIVLLRRLGMTWDAYEEFEKEMTAAGFRAVFTLDFEVRRDLSNPSDDVVKFVQLLTEYKFTESEVRTAIDEIFSQPNMHIHPNKFTVFTK